MLSVQLSPSQTLYTRRGTLVAVSGKAENAISTLSLLSPLTRAPLGMPFIYQRISSSSPISLLVAAKSATTSFATLHLDGRLDWMITQRTALLAWTGHTLTVKPRLNTKLAFQNWGNTFVSGRGIVALVGKGQIYQVNLKEEEEYVVHPGNVVAYSQNGIPPLPYRFKSTTLRLQIPSLAGMLPNTRFFVEMQKSQLWKFLAGAIYNIRTWTRTNVWGDRLFLQFKGPMTILVQSRGSRLMDSLEAREVNEIADAPAGVVRQVVAGEASQSSAGSVQQSSPVVAASGVTPAGISYATVSRGGKVDFKEGEKMS